MTYCNNCGSEGNKLSILHSEVYFDGDEICTVYWNLCWSCYQKIQHGEVDVFRAIVSLSNNEEF